MRSDYSVTTMGRIAPPPAQEDGDQGMLHSMNIPSGGGFMVGLDDGEAASEGGQTGSDDVGHSVGIATANPLPSYSTGTGLPGGMFDAIADEARREAAIAAAAAKRLLGGGGSAGPSKPAAGGGAGGGGLTRPGGAPGGGGVGMFGDLFGQHTDTVVIATGLLVAAGIAWAYFKHHQGTGSSSSTRRRAR